MVYFNRWTHRHLHSSSCCGSGSCIALTPFCSCTWRSDSSQCSCVATSQMFERLSLTLMRGNAVMLASRCQEDNLLPPYIDGVMWFFLKLSKVYLYIPPPVFSRTTHFRFGSSQRPLSTSGMARRTVVPTSASPRLEICQNIYTTKFSCVRILHIENA